MTFLAGCRGGQSFPDDGELVWGLLARQHAQAGLGASGSVRTAGRMALGAAGREGSLASDGRYLLVADAQLAARARLRNELGQPPEKSDAALLLAAWSRWGRQTPVYVEGEYAFAIWDETSDVLTLVRDALGQRPLFFLSNGAAFASRADVFDLLDPRYGRPCEHALAANLAFASYGVSSLYDGVERVGPGEAVTIRSNGIERHRWWTPSTAPDLRRTPADSVAECRALIEAAVAERVAAAAGPIATHLSAGLDSGVVTALAARATAPGGILHAFTAVPESVPAGTTRLADEGDQAAIAAASLPNVRHHRVLAYEDPLTCLWEAAEIYQQPLPNPHNHGWSAAINDAVREAGATDLLLGQFGNYSFSMSARSRAWVKQAIKRILRIHRPSMPQFPLLTAQTKALYDAEPSPTDSAEIRLYALREMDPGGLFKGVEQHWGLSVSDPLADRRLVEFSLTVPDRTLAKLGDRGLGRPVAAGLLPPAFVQHRARGYQSVDWIDRLQRHGPQVRALIGRTRDHAILRELLDLDSVAEAADRLEAGELTRPGDPALYRVHLPRALATTAFVATLAERSSRPELPAWRGARL